MFIIHQNAGAIGKSIPSALKISLNPRASPFGILSGVRDGFPHTYLVSVKKGYILSKFNILDWFSRA